MQEQDVGLILFRVDVNEAVGRAARDAPTFSKGGESNGCHCRISAILNCQSTVAEELESVWEMDRGPQLNQNRARMVSCCFPIGAVPCRIHWLLR